MYLQGLSAAPNPNCRDIHGAVMEWEARKFCPAPSMLFPMANGWWQCCMPPAPVASSAPANISVSVPTNIQTQVSPQISPNFIQQSNPQDSPVNASTAQTGTDPAMTALLREVAQRETAERQAAVAAEREAAAEAAAAREREAAREAARAYSTGAPVPESFTVAPGGGGETAPGSASATVSAESEANKWLIPALIAGGILVAVTRNKTGKRK